MVAKSRVTTVWHRLHGITERYLILAGQGRVEMGDLPPEAAGPAAVTLIPPGTPQRLVNTGAGDLIFLAICTLRLPIINYKDVEPV